MEANNKNHDKNHSGEKKKKGILASIWESMTKTGGCCGSGGSCGCESNDQDKSKRDELDEPGKS